MSEVVALSEFEAFRNRFTERLSASSLMMVPGASSDKISPEIRQIRRQSATEQLLDRRFRDQNERLQIQELLGSPLDQQRAESQRHLSTNQ